MEKQKPHEVNAQSTSNLDFQIDLLLGLIQFTTTKEEKENLFFQIQLLEGLKQFENL